jgi:hypothetical protein
MIEGSMTRRIGGTVLAFSAALLAAGCWLRPRVSFGYIRHFDAEAGVL